MPAQPSGPDRDGERRLFGAAAGEPSLLGLAGSIVVITVCALSIQPLGWSGRGLAVAILLVLNSLLLLTRHIPDHLVSGPFRIALLGAGAVAAAALVAEAGQGTPYLFAFFVAGHAGFRLVTRDATAIAVLTGALSAAVLIFKIGPGPYDLPWEVGAASAFAVLLGMVNRSERSAYQSAVQAARSAERASAAEAREAVLAERARIARDVHDVLAHSLAGISMQLELADALLDTGNLDRVREATHRAQSLVREGLLESQRTVHALRDQVLPLVETLRAMLESSGRDGDLDVVGTVAEIDTRVAQSLIRIAQESLTNVARHAPQAAVHLTLSYQAEAVALEICNTGPRDPAGSKPAAGQSSSGPGSNGPASSDSGSNGWGSNGSGAGKWGTASALGPGSGLGLVGMRERVALLGGTLTAGPVGEGRFDGGWRVWATIPV